MSLYLGENKIADNTSSRIVGEIITSSIPLADPALHLLDGAVINGAGSYAKFVNYIAGLVTDYPDLFVSESDWQSSVSTYGVCGKFVYDNTNNTVRLPKITGFTEGTIDPTVLGDLTEAGLPNIEGKQGGFCTRIGNLYSEGALSVITPSAQAGCSGASASEIRDLVFNASTSNSIYGNSDTVQPQSIKVLYYICIATYPKTQIEVDIDEIATDLNGKADTDLSNMNPTQAVKNTIVGWGMPDYSNGQKFTGTTFTAPSIGFVTVQPAGGVSGTIYVNGNPVGVGSNTTVDSSVQFYVDEGDIITVRSGFTFNGNVGSYFYPLKGVN